MSSVKTVYVGLSGGVDSSVTALLLKEQGYNVVGVHMKNWTKDIQGFKCPWQQDLQDAKRVATRLNIPFKVYDFQDEYFDRVVRYMVEAFERGETPNPDSMCNQEIKFKLFLDRAIEDGADHIATGHYAGIDDGRLVTAKDLNKDQTYFLYRMPKASLDKVIFPLEKLFKNEVRQLAEDAGFVTAHKKDSVGICFVGEVGLKEFLAEHVELVSGDIIDEDGSVVGRHEGALLYTVGQRHGLNITSGVPHYVTGKNMEKNEVYVSTNINDKALFSSSLKVGSLNLLGEVNDGLAVLVRTRHRGELHPATVSGLDQEKLEIVFDQQISAVAPGQSAVLYDQDGRTCLGGGIVAASVS